jgi:hypothetical protein
MRVRINDPALLDDLIAYLRSAECVAEPAGRDTVDVGVPRATSDEQGALELGVYLATWRAMHPGAQADVVS